jgi:uncharacterized protein YneF (UPF0154 family)
VKNLLLAVAFVACAIGGFFLADGTWSWGSRSCW